MTLKPNIAVKDAIVYHERNMLEEKNEGFASSLALGFIVACVVALVALILMAKFYSDANKYKNNANQLIAAAVAQAKQQESNLKDQEFKIASENPFLSYEGPSQYGSINLPYPRDWSGYVDSSGSNGNPLDVYFAPGVVQAITQQGNTYPLRMEVNANSYSDQLSTFTQQQGSGLSITPFAFKKVPSDIGVMIQGQIETNVTGVMVMVPLRTNTLMIWTESMQYASLLTNQILPSVSFSP